MIKDIRTMFLLIILAFQIVFSTGQEAEVETGYGRITGRIRELNGRQFTQFLGIPFAEPPVGELRFMPVQRHNGWNDDNLNAFDFPPACIQNPYFNWTGFPQDLAISEQSEDCLYLNIYITGNVSNAERSSLPVIVFIHGGGFSIGSAKFEIGDAFVTMGEPVVMVAIQYRLGILGFLSSGDDILSGNLGLKDQVFALQWVQENIANFGGDPNHVTICGESAGGESVLDHMISPMSSRLFHKASAQSPPMGWRYPTKEVAARYFERFAHSLNCLGDSARIIECLRTKTWRELYGSQSVSIDALSMRVIDGQFITDEPIKSWRSGQINEAELMVGFTSDDGGFLIDDSIPVDFASNRTQDLQIINVLLPTLLSLQLSEDLFRGVITRDGQELINFQDLVAVIKGRYYDSQSDPISKGRGIRDYARDHLFAANSLLAAEIVANSNEKVYVYLFDHRTATLRQSGPGEVELGADHDSELEYQFGYGFTHPDASEMTDEELALTRSIIHAWTSFAAGDAHYLDMNGQALDWPQYTTTQRNILIFDTQMSRDSVEDGTHTWQPVLDFWLAIDNLAQFEQDGERPTPPTASAVTSLPSVVFVLFAGASTLFV